MATKTKYYPLGGGLDVVTPALSVDPGAALAMINFEPWQNGGYRRIDGFERFDGRPKPSEQRFKGCDVDTVAGLVLGTTVVTGGTSGATGTICGIWDDDGTYGIDSIGIMRITGTFVNGETLTGGGSRVISSGIVASQAPSQDLEDTWTLYCQASYRTDILVVPGATANPVRGIWRRGANVYAVRDNVGLTAGILHKSSASGWTTSGITMNSYIYFSLGGGGAARALPIEGDTVTGGTSAATAVVHRIITHSGATATNDARGYMVIKTITGVWVNAEAVNVGGTQRATTASAATLFAFPVGGHYRWLNHNFYASSTTFRTYAVNSVGPGFEIDENNFVSPILMPLVAVTAQPAANTPFLIEEHGNTLFMAFPGGSMQSTVNGSPLQFSGFLGAAEFGMGDEITNLISVVGKVLVVASQRETRGLYGDPATIGTVDQNIELKLIGEKSGSKLYSGQKIADVYSLDDLGIAGLSRTDAFGDFMGATISQRVQPIISASRSFFTDSTIVRTSNQYRLYFSTGDCLIMFVPAVGSDNRAGSERLSDPQFGFASYPFPVRIAANCDDENGAERSYFLSDDGYVYEDRMGTNFDGAEIASYVRTAFNHVGSPAYRKRFRRADLELSSQRPLTLKFVSDITYGATDIATGLDEMLTTDVDQINVFAGGGFWDGTDNWDEFLWDGQAISTARANITGTGENVGFLIFNQSASVKPFVLQGITLHYDSRRLQR